MTDNDFQYDGLLVFNGLYEVQDSDGTPSAFEIEELPEYEEGAPTQPESGFVQIDLDLNDSTPAGRVLSSLDLTSIRYKAEEYDEINAIDRDGSEYLAFTRKLSTGEVFQLNQNRVFIRADRRAKDRISEIIRSVSKTHVHELSFEPDFLFWLTYKHHLGAPLSDDLDLMRITDATLVGKKSDAFGKESEIKGSSEITDSIPFIQSVLKGRAVESISGTFQVDTRYIRAKISAEGRVHIKSSEDIASASDSDRIQMSILFLYRLCALYEAWREMDREDKYPHPSYIEDLHDIALAEGVDIQYSLGDVITDLARKRSEDPQQYDLDL